MTGLQGLGTYASDYRGGLCRPPRSFSGGITGGAGRKKKFSTSAALGSQLERCSPLVPCVLADGVSCAASDIFPGGCSDFPAGRSDATVGVFSVGAGKLAAGVLSMGDAGEGAVVRCGPGEASPAGPPAAGGRGVSTLPRMIGRPSLPLPMMTTFELVD